MSIDNYYTKVNGRWEHIPRTDVPDSCTEFWVDIAQGANFAIDERYYFPDFASALDFYLEGWKERQFVDEKGNGVGLDHSGLYSRGRLIHGLSIHGDALGHEGETGEKMRRIMEKVFNRTMGEG